MINAVFMLGNLTADPQLRYAPSGTAICDFYVALNKKRKDAKGDTTDEVSYINVTAFGKTAENCAEYLHKGSKVMVQGELKQDRWDDKDGNKQQRVKVIAGLVQFLDGKPNGGGKSSRGYDPSQDAPF